MEPRAALRKVISRAADELTTAAGAVSAHAWAQTCTVRKHENEKEKHALVLVLRTSGVKGTDRGGNRWRVHRTGGETSIKPGQMLKRFIQPSQVSQTPPRGPLTTAACVL